MTSLRLRFVSRNAYKIAEVRQILEPEGIAIVAVTHAIEELQTDDSVRLIRQKAVAAYAKVRMPLLVEHTSLYLSYLDGLPGGLTQLFWDRLEANRFSQLFGSTPDPTAIARTHLAYVDGKTIQVYTGETKGRIAARPKGKPGFQWDCVFIPDGESKTFAQMGPAKKNAMSMRRQALDSFVSEFKRKGIARPA